MTRQPFLVLHSSRSFESQADVPYGVSGAVRARLSAGLIGAPVTTGPELVVFDQQQNQVDRRKVIQLRRLSPNM